MLEQRKQEERDFHDRLRRVQDDAGVAETRWSRDLERTIASDPAWRNMRFYAVERRSREFVLDWFRENTAGQVVLDLCCGNGEDGFLIAEGGAERVVGVDISGTSIENCRRGAKARGLANIEHEVMDAENLEFESGSFDVITEYGAMHHVDLEKAYAEMARVLRPDGKVICNEALGHNPVIRTYRRATPDLRTPYEAEHILRRPDFEIAKKYFRTVDLRFYHLATLLAVPFRRLPGFGHLLTCLEAVDSLLLRLPWLRWQAWQVVYIMADPIKHPESQ